MQKTQGWSLGWEDPLEQEMQPTQLFLPGKPHGQKNLAGYSPWGLKESDNWVTEHTHIVAHTHSRSISSVAQLCPTLCDPMDCSVPDLPVHHQLLEFTQTHVHWVDDAIQPSHSLLSPSPTFNLSQHQGLFNESVLRIMWPKYWSFSFSISPSNEYSGLISFRMA